MMVRSRSRSPRWKPRLISPDCGRSQEYNVVRPFYPSHNSESRGFSQSSGRLTQWRGQQEKWNETGSAESRSEVAQYGNIHYKVFEYRQPSPIARRMESDHALGRNFYPEEREENRSHALLSRSAEENPYHDHDERHESSDWHHEWHHGHSDRHHGHGERHHDRDVWRNDHDDQHYNRSAEILTRYKLSDEKSKTVRGDSQSNCYDRPSTTSYAGAEKWRDPEGFRSHSLHEERHSSSLRSPGRRSEEFLERSSYQKRYPEDNDVKGYREATGRGWMPGKLEAVDHERDLKWKGEKMPHNKKGYSSALYNDSENARIKDVSRNWYSDSNRFEAFVQVKTGFAHSQKYPEMHSSSEHHQSFSSERQQRYSSKDKEYTAGSLSAKEVSRFHSNSRRSGTDAIKAEGHYSASRKYVVPEHYSDRFPRAGKKEVSPRYTATSATRGRVERRKEFRNRSKDRRDDTRTLKRSNHGSYHVEASHCVANNEKNHTTESLTIKLDMKKTVNKYRPNRCNGAQNEECLDDLNTVPDGLKKQGVRTRGKGRASSAHCTNVQEFFNKKTLKKPSPDHYRRPASSHSSERLMSRDLVSVGKKRDEFHHVFEHMGSSLKANPNISSGEFAQEIITLVHQIKEDHFKSSEITLHDRFSKLQNAPSPQKEGQHLGPKIHRRIDMSLADLHSQEGKPVGRKTSTWVAVNPDDLRHDIERRRKERLRGKYEESFQNVKHKLLSHRSARTEKPRSSAQVKTSRNPHFKEPRTEFVEHRMRVARKPIVNFSKEYTSGRKKFYNIESKYRCLYGVGFGRTNPKVFTKHFKEGILRKRRYGRELPSSTTDK